MDNTAPTGSSRGLAGSRLSGTSHATSPSNTTMSGGFTMKMACQSKRSSSSPPAMGPMPTAAPATAAQMPMALARSAGSGNTWVSSDSVDGMMQAPPMPMSPRHAVRVVASPAVAAMAEANPKMPRPTSRMRWRPNRSPRLPAVSNAPANSSE